MFAEPCWVKMRLAGENQYVRESRRPKVLMAKQCGSLCSRHIGDAYRRAYGTCAGV